MEFATLNEALSHRASRQPERVAFRFLAAGEEETSRLDYRTLHDTATRLAAGLLARAAPGDRVLLAYASTPEFVAAFFGCLLAGLVAVPVQAPRRTQSFDKLRNILRDCGARVVLCDAALHASLDERLAETGERAAFTLVDTSAPAAIDSPACELPPAAADRLAFLQYTSGSTGEPKGVCVSQRQIAANSHMIARGFGFDASSVMVSWLPTFHDMGLIGSVIQPVFTGFPCVLMPPAAFVQKPARWLRAIDRYGASAAGGPNFGYDHCVQRVREQEIEGLDLSRWRVAYNGAEPVREPTLRRFAERFARSGFDARAWMPCYGLAEATLLVANRAVSHGAHSLRIDAAEAGRGRVRLADDAQAPASVSCGSPPQGCGGALRIVDVERTQALPEDRIGEICIAGPHVTSGYWRGTGPAAPDDRTWIDPSTGHAYLRTGDLGFLHAGELHVCGRLKELLVLKGRNVFPQDIEAHVERAHDAFELNASAAFTVDDGQEERLVVLQEIRRDHRCRLDVDDCRARVRAVLAREFGLAPHDIVLVPPLTLPKTSSGKIMRGRCRALYLDRRIEPAASPQLQT